MVVYIQIEERGFIYIFQKRTIHFFFLTLVFKVRTARKDGVKYNMKLFADMKPEKKLSIKKFANHRIQKSCSCGVLELKGNVKMQHHRVSKEIA